MTDLARMDATEQAGLVRRGDASAAELVEAAIERIDAVNPELNAVIHSLADQARARANDPALAGPFAGVPIVMKDLDGALAGAPSHRGNRLLKALGHVDDHDSFLNARLRRAGFVPVGRTNTPEFGIHPTTEPDAYGPTRNPWDPSRSTGGSSGGSAAAVASGMVPLGHAGDGGGSIRIPASACGVFGLKPSRGRVSLGPDQAESWHGNVQRHVVTRSVRDSAAVLDLIAGREIGDPYAAWPPSRPFLDEVGADPGRLRIAFTTTPVGGICVTRAACVAAVHDVAQLLESLGHHVEAVAPDAYGDAGASFGEWWVTMLASWIAAEVTEVGTIAGRPMTADDMEANTWSYAELGRSISADRYLGAITHLQRWARTAMAFHDTAHPTARSGFDVLLTPTLAVPPPPLGWVTRASTDPDDGGSRAIPMAAFAAPANITGQPAMSMPLVWQADTNLPIGVQFLGPMYGEDILFRLASQLESARPWAERQPMVHA